MGHHVGTDARSFAVQISHYVTDDLVANVACDWRTQTVGPDRRTDTDICAVGVAWFLSEDWQAQGGYRFEQGDGGDNHIAEVGLIRRF